MSAPGLWVLAALLLSTLAGCASPPPATTDDTAVPPGPVPAPEPERWMLVWQGDRPMLEREEAHGYQGTMYLGAYPPVPFLGPMTHHRSKVYVGNGTTDGFPAGAGTFHISVWTMVPAEVTVKAFVTVDGVVVGEGDLMQTIGGPRPERVDYDVPVRFHEPVAPGSHLGLWYEVWGQLALLDVSGGYGTHFETPL